VRPYLLKQAVPLMFGATFRRQQPQVVEQWAARFARLDPGGLFHAVRMVAGRPSVEERLAEIEAPALVIAGAEDAATPPALGERLAGRLPKARLEILPATGHLSTVERPERTSQLIRGFLEEIGW
jgi:pimeloyl-ACP methyl ester carboxylesterase